MWSSADCITNNSTLKKLWFQKAFIVCSLLHTLPKIMAKFPHSPIHHYTSIYGALFFSVSPVRCTCIIKYGAVRKFFQNNNHPDIIWIAKVFLTSYPLLLDNTVVHGKSYCERLARIASQFFYRENYRTLRGQHDIVFSWRVFLFCLEVVLPSSFFWFRH